MARADSHEHRTLRFGVLDPCLSQRAHQQGAGAAEAQTVLLKVIVLRGKRTQRNRQAAIHLSKAFMIKANLFFTCFPGSRNLGFGFRV
eukprot:scaffold282754_cov19-Prasinocladus_malaysianus.AAC.1